MRQMRGWQVSRDPLWMEGNDLDEEEEGDYEDDPDSQHNSWFED
jgi:hypothetical protein